MNVNKLASIAGATLGTEIPVKAVPFAPVPPVTADPDDMTPFSSDAFVFPLTPGFLFKVVSSWDEIAEAGGALVVPSNASAGYMLLTRETINGIRGSSIPAFSGTVLKIGNDYWANKPEMKEHSPYFVSAGTITSSHRVYAWHTHATHGSLIANSVTVGAKHPNADEGSSRTGFVGHHVKVSTLKAVLESYIPTMLADAPSSKMRECLRLAWADELPLVTGDYQFMFGVSFAPVFGTHASRLNEVAGILGYHLDESTETALAAVPTVTNPTMPAGRTSYISNMTAPFAMSAGFQLRAWDGVIDPHATSNLTWGIMQGYSVVDGNDLQPDLAALSQIGSQGTRSVESFVAEQVAWMDRLAASEQMAADRALTSPNAFTYQAPEGPVKVGSASAINSFSQALFAEKDPVYGEQFAKLTHHLRRVYARAERYASKVA